MKLTHLSHCVYHCNYHIVITTKYRKPIFNNGVFSYFDIQLAGITEHYPQIQFIKVNHDKDHMHLLVSIPPTTSVGKVVGIIKQNTAKELKKKFSFIKDTYWGTESVWSGGYFVSTVGINETMIKQYIKQQGEKDSGQIRLGFE
jgi:putative transposase